MSEFRANALDAFGRDEAIPPLAARQFGVVSTRQLRAAGLDEHHILHRVRTGRLHRIHRGVYAVGHPHLSFEGCCMAAVLACGRSQAKEGLESEGEARAEEKIAIIDWWGAAVSHRSAAAIWKLLPDGDNPIDISVPGNTGKRSRKGVRIHRSPTLVPAAVSLRNRIPVTTPARTIADLRRSVSRPGRAGPISAKELRRAMRQANVLGLPLDEVADRDRTRSDLERDFLRLCRRHRMPRPDVNVMVGRDLVDFLWRNRRLVVETDGYRYHRGRVAFEDDRERDLRLRALGFDVVRVSEKQVNEEPDVVAEAVVAALRVGADARQ